MRCTNLKVVEGFLVLHKLLLGDIPSYTDGGEETPFLLIFGATVSTESNRSQIAVVVVITCTHEGTHAVIAGCTIRRCLVFVEA